MVPRTLVPADARIRPDETGAVSETPSRQQLLVPRRLIPVNAVLGVITLSSNTTVSLTRRNSIVPRLLVPMNALTGPIGTMKPRVQKNIFQESLLLTHALALRRNPADWLISLAMHAAIIAAVFVVRLYYTQTIDMSQVEITFLVAPLPPAAPPPPPPALGLNSRQARGRSSLTRLSKAKLTIPSAIPRYVQGPAKPEETDSMAGVPEGVIGGVPGGQIGGVLGGVLGGIPGGVLGGVLGGSGSFPPPPPPPLPVVSTKPLPEVQDVKPLPVGGNVKEPQAIYKPQPKYPLLAWQARIEGDVRIDAIIDEHGNVIEMRAVSGPPLLIDAALEAVKQWKYQPTYLNGVPWPIELTIHVTFSLS